MENNKILLGFALAIVILAAQANIVLAASDPITGTVQSITLDTNTDTAVTTVLVTLLDDETSQTVRISIETAIELGLVMLNGDGNSVINETILGQPVEIDQGTVITVEQLIQHPVGNALAAFFSDIPDLDYESIMTAYDEGTGFGVIAQALWLTKKMEGDVTVFLAIIEANKTNDFSNFVLADGTTLENWGQFKKAVLDGSRNNLGVVMKNKDNHGAGNDTEHNKGNHGNSNGKDKNDKNKNGNGNKP
jgi:hypothetical protein